MAIRENLEKVRARIEAAARRAGRDPAEVHLIGVTKGIPVDKIREAIACGVAEIGENRVQEAREKERQIGRHVRWHLVGTLQRNKAKPAAELFNVIHSVDSLELIEALNRHAADRPTGRPADGPTKLLEVLIQVNVSAEATRQEGLVVPLPLAAATKHGCRSEEAATLAEAILKSKGLTWTGLMTMAPFSENPESARLYFRKLRQLRDDLQGKFSQSLLHLSMGMSQDFEAAVEEGATFVRIGTAIFQP